MLIYRSYRNSAMVLREALHIWDKSDEGGEKGSRHCFRVFVLTSIVIPILTSLFGRLIY